MRKEKGERKLLFFIRERKKCHEKMLTRNIINKNKNIYFAVRTRHKIINIFIFANLIFYFKYMLGNAKQRLCSKVISLFLFHALQYILFECGPFIYRALFDGKVDFGDAGYPVGKIRLAEFF